MTDFNKSFLPPSPEVVRARRVKNFSEALLLMAIGRGDPLAVLKAGNRRLSPEVHNIAAGLVEQQRAAIGALNTDESSGDALINYGNAAASWIGALATSGVFDRIANDGVQLPLMIQHSAVVTDAFAASEISEAQPKKVARLTLESLGVVRLAKAIGLVAVSQELLRFSGARDFLNSELTKAVVAATDALFLGDLIGATTPIVSTAAEADFAALVAALTYGSNAKLYYVVSPKAAGKIATTVGTSGNLQWPNMTPTGGTMAGVPTLISDSLPTGTGVMFDAAQVGANSGEVRVDSSTVADIQMDNAPTNSAGAGSPPTPVPTTIVSLWQTNSVALRVERYFLAKLLRSGAVASLSGVSY